MKKCLETYKNDVKENVMIQKLLSELSEMTLASTIEKIQSSIFYNDSKKMKILITSIGNFIKIRRGQIKYFFRLISNLMPKITQFFDKEEIMSLFKRKEIHLKLLKDGYLTILDVVSFYGFKNRTLAFFYPELLELSTEYPSIIEDSKQSQKYRDVIEYFTTNKTINEDPRLSEGNFDTLSIIIRKDDIDKFQKFVANNEIKIKNFQIKITSFETNKCFNQTHVYLLEYAAYHCSIKIFKFLMMNNTTFSNMLLRCAICGGNSEIIHMTESEIISSSFHQNKSDLLSLSISFHRYKITEYLIDSCSISIEYNDYSNSILASNYFFFFNNIIDCNNEYNRLLDLKKNGDLSDEDDFKYNELKDKANELALIAVQNIDSFFLKVVSCFSEIDLNLTGSYGLNQKKITCPLVMAIQSRNIENTKFLLSLDSVDPDWKIVNDTTPFLWACYIGDLEIVKFLIDNFYLKKNSNENDIENENESTEQNDNLKLNYEKSGSTELNLSYESCEFSNSEIIKLENSNKNHEMNISKKVKRIDILQLVEQSGENALHLATRECHLDVVKYLVSLNVYDLASESLQGETCIQVAARLGYKDIFEFLKSVLIESGIQVDENIKVNEQKYLPQLHIKPLAMGLNLFDNLKEPISICLLI